MNDNNGKPQSTLLFKRWTKRSEIITMLDSNSTLQTSVLEGPVLSSQKVVSALLSAPVKEYATLMLTL